MRCWRWFLLGTGVFLVPSQVHALDPSRTVFQYNLQTWTRQNGLPVNRIRAITQTADGYLWMGTQNGLVRFDGKDFTHAAVPNRVGWRSQGIDCLTPSSRGGFWFGMKTGSFGHFDGKNRFEGISGNWVAPQMNVHGVQETSDGSIWLGGRNGIVGLIGGKTNQPFLDSQMGEVLAVYEDPQHRVWFGSVEKGLYYWESGKLNAFPDRALIGNTIRAIAMDQDGRLWVGTSMGLHCYNRAFERADALTYPSEVQALLADQHGAMWVGTTGDGLARYLKGETSWLRKTNGLTEDYVNALYEDHEGSLWVGTRDGLTQISDLKFPTPSTATGLLNDPVHGVCASSNGGIWCATSLGIYNYNRKSVLRSQEVPGANPYVKRVMEASNGDVYLLTGGREIQIMADGKLVARHSNGQWPVAIAEDSHGVVVALGDKLYRVNRTELTPFVFQNPAPEFYWVRNLFACADGSLLVASVNGVFRIHDERVEHWTTADGLPDQDIGWINEDDDGTIWIGQATGLSRIKNHKVTVIHNEILDTLVYAIVPDNFGNLWISCNKGVVRVNRRNLNDFADARTAHLELRLYDGIEALRTIDLTEVESVACKTADGSIWLPGPLGAVQIDPSHIPTNPVPPPVYIQKVLVNGVEQSGSSAKVRPGKGELVFQYTAVSFVAPQRIRFRYKLEGYDSDWIDAGSQRSALYANLRPKKYIFQVQACNVDGVWNRTGASVEIELPPHLYQTTWAQALAGVSIALCLFGIYGWRVKHLRHKEKILQATNDLLESKIRERTQELAEQRNLLRTLIDHLPDEVFVKDTKGRVIINNLAHARSLGVDDPTDAIGKTDFDCLPNDKAEQFRRSELVLLNTGKEYNGEEFITLKSGETRWLRTTKVPLRDARGEIIGLAGIHRDITERKKGEAELELLHKQLLETSRHAGMAEVATSVLHNVGNVLNSVNISASIVDEQVRNSVLERLDKVIRLLQEHQSDLSHFLTQDEKGTKLVNYMDALFKMLTKERATIQDEVASLTKNVEHIKKIVSMQQTYARVAGLVETISPVELVEDSLRMHEAAFHRHGIKIIREYSEVPKIAVDRHKVIQILVNLFQNAKYACDVNDSPNRVIRVCIDALAVNRIRIQVIDNGMGIAAENLTRIFSYGFTTRKNGHGFGLHSGALAAKEMGGSLNVQSEGPGLGSTFILELPVENKVAAKLSTDHAKAVASATDTTALVVSA